MSAAADLGGAVAALYRLPLSEFVGARDQLARQLRAGGDREAARQVAGCGGHPGRAADIDQLRKGCSMWATSSGRKPR